MDARTGDLRGASRWPRTLGTAVFAATLLLYRSWEDRSVLGLWSPAYAAVLAAVAALLGLVLFLGWRSRRAGRAPSTSARLADAALLVWSGAYLASALDDRDTAARVLDANLFGSVMPMAALGEWLALCLGVVAAGLWLARRLGETGRRVLLSAGALLLVALFAEGALRLRAAIAPQTQGFPTLTSKQWIRRHVSLNSEGFRDVEHEKARSPGRRRLLVIGDSFAFGSGVDEIGDRLGERLAEQLSDRRGESWVSVTAARPDSHTLEEIAYLEQMDPYARDGVVLVYVFNDIDYLVPVTSRTILTDRRGGLLGRIHPARVAFLNSYLVQEVLLRVRLASYALADDLTPSQSAYDDAPVIDRHLGDLARFVDRASRGGVPVWIVPFDLNAGLEGPPGARYRRFVTAAEERGLPVLSLEGAFEGEDRMALWVNRLDAHPNARAHGLAAEWLAPAIADDLSRREEAD